MNRFGWGGIVLGIIGAVSCGEEGGIRLVLTGRVISGIEEDQGREGVRVEVPRTGASTTTSADGSFRLTTRLPEAPDGGSVETAVHFLREGFAPVVQVIRAFPDAEVTLLVRMTHPGRTEEVILPTGENETLVDDENGVLYFRKDSLLDPEAPDGTILTGTVRVRVAFWDASWPPMDRFDALEIPLPRYSAFSPSAAIRLQPLAALWFDLDRGVPKPDPGIGVELLCRYGDISFPGLPNQARDAFFVDPETGIAEPLAEGRVAQGPRLLFPASRTGLWIWATPDPTATCVSVTVKRGRRPAPGAHLVLWETSFRGDRIRRLDEQVGASQGAYCLRAPSGRQVRLDAHLFGQGAIQTETRTLVPSGGGSCSADCATTLEIVFSCASDDDCDAPETCIQGACGSLSPTP